MSSPTPISLSTRLHRMAAWVRGHESYTRRRIADDLEKLAGECGEQGEPTALSPTQMAAAEAAFSHVLTNHGVALIPAPPLMLAVRAAVRAALASNAR